MSIIEKALTTFRLIILKCLSAKLLKLSINTIFRRKLQFGIQTIFEIPSSVNFKKPEPVPNYFFLALKSSLCMACLTKLCFKKLSVSIRINRFTFCIENEQRFTLKKTNFTSASCCG